MHNLLLYKLSRYGIDKKILCWIKSYLKNKKKKNIKKKRILNSNVNLLVLVTLQSILLLLYSIMNIFKVLRI